MAWLKSRRVISALARVSAHGADLAPAPALECARPSRYFLGVLGRVCLSLLTSLLLPPALAAHSAQDTRPLELNKPVERELAAGQTHSYLIALDAGQYLRVIADQRGIDVVVVLFAPDGTQLVEVDSPNGTQGPEHVSAIMKASGNYRLEVRSLEKGAPAGRYNLKIEELRKATQQDESRVTAEGAFRQAEQLLGQGMAESLRGALNKYEEALRRYHSVGDTAAEAFILTRIGLINNSFGEKQKALNYYTQALPLYRAVGDREGEVTILNNIGGVYDDLGERQKALDYYKQALSLARAIGHQGFEAGTLSNIAGVYNDLGEREIARDYYMQALPLRRVVGDKRGEATTLSNLGGLYYDLGDKQKALDYYAQALPLRRAVNDRNGEAVTLSNMGRAYNDLGERHKALDFTTQALSLFRAVGNYSFEAGTLANLGQLYHDLGDNKKAINYYKQALPVTTALRDRNATAKVLHNLMKIHAALNDVRLATFYGKQSVEAYQELRSNIVGLDKNVQKTFLRLQEPTYRTLAELLIEQNRASEAQQVLNAFKDQQFFDLDRSPRGRLGALTLTPLEEELVLRLHKIVSEVSTAGSKNEELATQLKTASAQFYTVLTQAEIEFSKPTDEKDKVGEVSDTTQMHAMLRQLKKDTGQTAVAVYTLVGEAKFYALIVTADGITSASSAVGGAELNKKARDLWGLLQSDAYDPNALSNELYNIVFKPVGAKLPKDTKTILWSLDGNLRYLPMAALYDGSRYLVERYNHVNFTRADRERMTRAVTRNWTTTGFGTSAAHTVEFLGNKIAFGTLPGVGEELRLLVRQEGNPHGIFDGETLQDAQFTKAAMLSALRRKRPLLHIASHFAFRPGDEERSFLLMGDGTAFPLSEMKQQVNLFDGVELLTLSACNTAAQQPGANGREIDAFAELAQRLGAHAVMATLWSVADNSTPWLMREFYQTRQNQALNKADALRRAQLALLTGRAKAKPLPATQKGAKRVQVLVDDVAGRTGNGTRAELVFVEARNAVPFKKDPRKPFSHPYYWSPFILVGNWR